MTTSPRAAFDLSAWYTVTKEHVTDVCAAIRTPQDLRDFIEDLYSNPNTDAIVDYLLDMARISDEGFIAAFTIQDQPLDPSRHNKIAQAFAERNITQSLMALLASANRNRKTTITKILPQLNLP